MEEDISLCLQMADEAMSATLQRAAQDLAKIRAGKATPSMLDHVRVDYYGSMTPVAQVASVSTSDARTVVIKPWEKKMIAEIEKAIRTSDLGINPQNDGEVIRLVVPQLSGERRQELVKKAKVEAENARVKVRNIRKETNEALRKLQKDGAPEDAIKKAEEDSQNLTNKYIKKVDDMVAAKETEITTV